MPRVKGVRIRTRFLRSALRASVPRVGLLAGLPAAAQTPAGQPPAGQTVAGANRPLGRLEQQSVDDAMKTLGQPLIDPAPQGKTIARVFVINEDVFSQRDWYFQLLNIFHWTTRSYILERELLLRPGDAYDQALV